MSTDTASLLEMTSPRAKTASYLGAMAHRRPGRGPLPRPSATDPARFSLAPSKPKATDSATLPSSPH
jgi:hypothetical protein